MPSAGEPANAPSTYPTISGDGRFVTFTSFASNLVDGDVDGTMDVFLTNIQTLETRLVSRLPDGEPTGASSYGYFPSISADGRFVVFNSDSPALSGDPIWNVYLYDANTDTVQLISKSIDGNGGNAPSMHGVVSGDGAFVAFHSLADNLVSDDTNGVSDVFLADVTAGTISLVSKSSEGEPGNLRSERPGISFDGDRISFSSEATNLSIDDTNGREDVFVFDKSENALMRASISVDGDQFAPVASVAMDSKSVMSADGRFVAFRSTSATLADPNADVSVQIYLRDLDNRTTELISALPSGSPIPGNAEHHALNFDGSVLAFTVYVTHRSWRLSRDRVQVLNGCLRCQVSTKGQLASSWIAVAGR